MSHSNIKLVTHIGTQVPKEEAYPLIMERIKRRLLITDRGCWEYQGARNYLGYAQITFQQQRWMVHRLTYTIHKGDIPAGLDILHSCDNPPCCNPDHLRAGTQRENSLEASRKGRMPGQSKTHCKHGHEYTPENTYWSRRGDGTTQKRTCRECGRIKSRREILSGVAAARQRRRKARLRAQRLFQSEEVGNEP